jgi:exonuclease VII small subunit
MRDVDDFHLIDQGRLRLGDRLRFLFFGRAYKRRFVARAARCGIVFSASHPSYRLLFAVAGVSMLCVAGWLGEQLHQARTRNQSMAADLYNLRVSQAALPQPQTVPPGITERAPEVRIVRENPDETAQRGHADLERSRADLERAWADARDLGEQLKQAREQVDSLRSEIAGSRSAEARLSDQLRESELRVTGITTELARLQAGRSEDTEIIAAQRLRLREITDRLNALTDTIDRERKLLVADLDIRELMGARSLHIVDVFDVDGKGKTQRPFGRIFYTQGKSLLFYAFDLKSGGTFQAWGQRETRDESAQSLGMFYVDDQKQNRWVLKFEDPKVLAEINAVFVTVEPPGGSIKPNRQKMLYAYLNATPNHP